VLELVVLGATLALAAGASGVEGWRRIAATRALDRFARWRGHHFAPPKPEVGAKSPRAFGTRGGATFAIDFCRIRGRPHTRVEVDPPAGRLARIDVVRRRGAYIVYGLDPADEDELRAASATSLARLDGWKDVRLSSDGARVTLVWAGLESDPMVLDSALDLAVAVARFERPSAPYR
jgi:hypothetical protein